MTALNASTTGQLNNLIEFRQTVYNQIVVKGRDAQVELVDALLLSDHPRCFAEISQPEEGQQDRQRLSR
ncbi:MAG: hypothetical protein L6R45_04090 [Anaerolineae bacterium]|nr:hypothetical protein [Anaerolineae bacterium]